MEGLTPRYAQAPLPRRQVEEEVEEEAEEEVEEVVEGEVEEGAEEEAEEEVEEEVEAEALEEHSPNPSIKGTSESKERYPRNSKATAPRPKNSLKICEATFA